MRLPNISAGANAQLTIRKFASRLLALQHSILIAFFRVNAGLVTVAARATGEMYAGPGSSSVWLHVSPVGPRQVAFGDDVHPEITPTYDIADNPDSRLDFSKGQMHGVLVV